jgi:hypothetical protein
MGGLAGAEASATKRFGPPPAMAGWGRLLRVRAAFSGHQYSWCVLGRARFGL